MDIEKVNILMKNLSKEPEINQDITTEGVKKYRLEDIPEKIVELNSQPYKKKKYFFSVAELKFFEILKEIIGDNYYIFPKVRICDIVNSEDKNNYSQFNKIKSKHVDFLICTKDPIASKIVVELDDSSHDRESRIKRDRFVDEVFASSGIPIVHIRAKSFYDKEILIKELQKAYKTKYVFIEKNSNSQGIESCSLLFVLVILVFSFIFFI